MTLREISEELEAMDGDDPEADHIRADELLLEAIRTLAPYATDTANEGDADRVIEAFGNVAKWYA